LNSHKQLDFLMHPRSIAGVHGTPIRDSRDQ
jgi:hypothetical protein